MGGPPAERWVGRQLGSVFSFRKWGLCHWLAVQSQATHLSTPTSQSLSCTLTAWLGLLGQEPCVRQSRCHSLLTHRPSSARTHVPGTQPETGALPGPARLWPDRPVPTYKGIAQAAAALWPRARQATRSLLRVLALVGFAGVKQGARTRTKGP